ncbi:MAG: cyclodeaminase/cyclohydrolase family protein [Tissierellaceae bacterium]|nr:cyclodeaminase/cyclohydrolase family protein [Tissierellaceae bacterium]
MLSNLTIEQFSGELGSDSPAPGGGSVSALAGMLGADLIGMVCSLTIGKKDFSQFDAELKEILKKVNDLSNKLRERIDLDTEAFNDVMKAFKLPKETPEEKSIRKEAIQMGYKSAVQSPLDIGKECLDVLKLGENMLGKFNLNAASDLGVGAEMAYSGLEGAIMNIEINLLSIKDEEFVKSMEKEIAEMLSSGDCLKEKIYDHVKSAIS